MQTVLTPNIIPSKHSEQDQIDVKWLRKKLVLWGDSGQGGY